MPSVQAPPHVPAPAEAQEVGGPAAVGPPRWLRRALVVAPVALLVIMAWHMRWMSDDGFIHLRVVDQLLHGNGPVFNAGERVEASTSPLWVFLLAATRLAAPLLSLEWIAVLWGIALAAFALEAAQRGGWLVWRAARGSRFATPTALATTPLPLGALAIAVLAPFWEFATSGLENGMAFAWLGGTFWALAAAIDRTTAAPTTPTSTRRACWTAVLIGLAPLIRPDLAVYVPAFLIALVMIDSNHRWRHRLVVLGAGVALPLAFQLFRMAYYASLVPNTAIAKEAATAQWEQGLRYWWDFTSTYLVWIPLAALVVGFLGRLLRAEIGARRYALFAVTVSPVVGGLLHALYVVYIGGDFMHARFALAPFFAVLLPVAVVPMTAATASRVATVCAVVVGAWAIVAVGALRVGYATTSADGLSNEREGTVLSTGRRNPVSIGDFVASSSAGYGVQARRLASHDARILWVVPSKFFDHEVRVPLRADSPYRMVIAYPFVGQVSYAAGVDVAVVDTLSLGDAVASHTRPGPYVLAGHNKHVSPAWGIARYASTRADLGDRELAREVAAAAGRALACGDLSGLVEAVSAPPDAQRLLTNVRESVTLTRLRYGADPRAAERELCHP